MKNKNKNFDAVKLMRALKEKINKEIANMTTEEIVDYFHKGSKQYEKEITAHSLKAEGKTQGKTFDV